MRHVLPGLTSAFLLAALGPGCEARHPSEEPRPAASRRAALEVEPSEQELQRTLAQDPPRVEELTIAPLQGLDPTQSWVVPSVLTVRFAQDRVLPPQIDIALESGNLVLSTSGNNVYQGALNFDFAALDWEFQRIDIARSQVGGDGSVPVFQGRQLVDRIQPPLWDPEWFRQRLEEGGFIDLKPGYVGFPQLVSPPNSLFINEPGVVNDPLRTTHPCGNTQGGAQRVWSFGYLMTQLANQQRTGITPSQFTRNWLEKWHDDRLVNGWTVPERDDIGEIIQQWETASGGSTLDMDKAPFRLLAIVNRIDLADNPVYGGGNGGEGRFIFAWVNSQCQTRQFTVIFEYGVPAPNCQALKSWAQEWKALDTMTPGAPDFNQALENITQVFAQADADPSKPNGSALNQIRTNEVELMDPWQLREFRFLEGDGFLSQTTVAQTPDTTFNETQTLADYVNGHEALILSERHVVPLEFQGNVFRGGSSEVVPDETFFWKADTIQSNEARHLFAVQTCNGCHARETGTQFTHINVNTRALSRFLTGNFMPITDPVDATARTFGDLERRAALLDSIANQMCLFRILDPHNIGH